VLTQYFDADFSHKQLLIYKMFLTNDSKSIYGD